MVLGVDVCFLPNGTVALVTGPYELFGQFVPFILVAIKIVEHPRGRQYLVTLLKSDVILVEILVHHLPMGIFLLLMNLLPVLSVPRGKLFLGNLVFQLQGTISSRRKQQMSFYVCTDFGNDSLNRESPVRTCRKRDSLIRACPVKRVRELNPHTLFPDMGHDVDCGAVILLAVDHLERLRMHMQVVILLCSSQKPFKLPHRLGVDEGPLAAPSSAERAEIIPGGLPILHTEFVGNMEIGLVGQIRAAKIINLLKGSCLHIASCLLIVCWRTVWKPSCSVKFFGQSIGGLCQPLFHHNLLRILCGPFI